VIALVCRPRDARDRPPECRRVVTALEGKAAAQTTRLVVLPDIAIRSVQQIHVLVQLISEERLAKSHLHFSLTGECILSPLEAHVPNNLVNIVHNSLDHDRGVTVSDLFKEFRQGVFSAVFLFKQIAILPLAAIGFNLEASA